MVMMVVVVGVFKLPESLTVDEAHRTRQPHTDDTQPHIAPLNILNTQATTLLACCTTRRERPQVAASSLRLSCPPAWKGRRATQRVLFL